MPKFDDIEAAIFKRDVTEQQVISMLDEVKQSYESRSKLLSFVARTGVISSFNSFLTSDGNILLLKSISANKNQIAKYLLENPAVMDDACKRVNNIKELCNQMLLNAVSANNTEMVKFLLDQEAISKIAHRGNNAALKIAIDLENSGADTREIKELLLNIEKVKELNDKPAEPQRSTKIHPR